MKQTREQILATIELLTANDLIDQAKHLQQLHFGKELDEHPERDLIKVDEWLSKLQSDHEAMKLLKKHTKLLAPLSDTVLICGESGTGKEIVAHALHGNRKGKFIPINCAGMPETLIESELFGHEAGAFTGAAKAKTGLFKEAKDGTLFLDEVGELPLTLQAKLLRVLQSKKIRKVGSNSEEEINCRVIAATHRDLPELVLLQQFRLDLYQRLAVFELYTVPLAARISDIPGIVKSLDSTGKFPANFDWESYRLWSAGIQGNVREIQAIVRRFEVLKELPSMVLENEGFSNTKIKSDTDDI